MDRRISVRLPASVVEALDRTARRERLSRGAVVCRAIEQYLEDSEDLSAAIDRLQDGADPSLDWERVRPGILAAD